MIKCPFCHYENEDGALFCERCTSDVSGVAPTGSPKAAPPPPMMAEPIMAEPLPVAAEPIMAEAMPFEAIPMAAEPIAAEPIMAEALPLEIPMAAPPPPAAVAPAPPPPPTPAPVAAPEPPAPPAPAPAPVPVVTAPAPAMPLLEPMAVVLRRYSDVSFPPRTQVGKPTNLRVCIAAAKHHAHDDALDLNLPEGIESVPVTICVAVENFTIEGTPWATLHVTRQGDSAAIQFRLIGERPGPGRIMIDFSQDGRPVGSVDLAVEVVETATEAVGAPTRRGEVRLRVGSADCPDVTLMVHEYRYCPGRLHFTLFSRLPRLADLPWVNYGDLGVIDLRQDTIAWVEQHLDAINCWDSAGQDRALADLGNRLYDQVLPPLLQHLCWALDERQVKTVLVVSDEPHIPWELIRPHRINPQTRVRQELPFWGETFALSRWLRGPALAERFRLRHVCAVVPERLPPASVPGGPARNLKSVPSTPTAPPQATAPMLAAELPGARRELQTLLALEAGGARVEVLLARRREVLAAFERGEFDLLHVASHGYFGGARSADASSILLEDGAFQAGELPPRLADRLCRSAPLVFFNACQTGRGGYSLTRLGAWGAELIRLGCGGFIGTQWWVTDDVALEVAREFYRLLFQGKPIAEALRLARHKARSLHPHDPTWLAYSCFADPNARLSATAPAGAALPDRAQPRLLVLRGQKRNVEYPIYEGLNFVGRADEKPVDIDLEEQEPPDRIWCSRQHACISFEESILQIEDLNSANGTYVNRTRVYPGQKRPLNINDIVQIGNVQLKVLA